MLVSIYTSKGRFDEAEQCARLSPERAQAQAGKVIGRPPKKALARALVDPLRTTWVPRLPVNSLADLVRVLQLEVSGPARLAQPKTKEELIRWIRERNRTETHCGLLLSEFTNAHKRDNGTVRSAKAARVKAWAGPVTLSGQGTPESLQPHPHQLKAWQELESLAASSVLADGHGRRVAGGLVVIPTGGGKTFTAVRWLTTLIEERPDARVLWLADRQELIDQAARAFVRQAPHLPHRVTRRMRVVHGNGSAAKIIHLDDAHIVCATRQSIIGKSFGPSTKPLLAPLLRHPVVVVVDEAHHAVAPTYRRLLDHVATTAPVALMIGLTATPWPTGAGMTAALHDRFPTTVVDVDPPTLIATKVLARPVVHSLATDEDIWLDGAELKAATSGDLPPSVLRKLDRSSRNRLIVATWLEKRATWGKTLVFACDIAHADALGEMFRQAGARTSVVHSESEESVAEALKSFSAGKTPRVLVSVDVLREGVDLPDARSAFLARPTRSPIVLRQMVGRVLRGPGSGGEELAHIVDLRDRWRGEVEILSPLDLADVRPDSASSSEDGDPSLPLIFDEESQQPIATDVLRSIFRQYREARVNLPHAGALQRTTLVGYYRLSERNVPVFDHTRARWSALIADLLRGRRSRSSPVEWFDDLPLPRPPKTDVNAVVGFVRGYQVEPPLVELSACLSPQQTAQALVNRPAETEIERQSWLRDQFNHTLARFAYPDYESFRHVVLAHADRLLGLSTTTVDIEAPRTPRSRPKTLKRRPSRRIQPLFSSAVRLGRELLADEREEYSTLLDTPSLPEIQWTMHPVSSTLAYWAPRISGRRRGRPVIRVNRALQAPVRQVSDEVLEYLIWHELCHHVLPGHGHDHEFRRLEGLWPDSSDHDASLERLCETYDLGKSST